MKDRIEKGDKEDSLEPLPPVPRSLFIYNHSNISLFAFLNLVISNHITSAKISFA